MDIRVTLPPGKRPGLKADHLPPSNANIKNTQSYTFTPPIPVAARSKAWVFGRSLTGIVGSNPAGGMDVCVVFVVLGR